MSQGGIRFQEGPSSHPPNRKAIGRTEEKAYGRGKVCCREETGIADKLFGVGIDPDKLAL